MRKIWYGTALDNYIAAFTADLHPLSRQLPIFFIHRPLVLSASAVLFLFHLLTLSLLSTSMFMEAGTFANMNLCEESKSSVGSVFPSLWPYGSIRWPLWSLTKHHHWLCQSHSNYSLPFKFRWSYSTRLVCYLVFHTSVLYFFRGVIFHFLFICFYFICHLYLDPSIVATMLWQWWFYVTSQVRSTRSEICKSWLDHRCFFLITFDHKLLGSMPWKCFVIAHAFEGAEIA